MNWSFPELSRGERGLSEAGVTVVLTAILISVLVAALSLALSHSYTLLVEREARSAADAASLAATVSLCATAACWEDAKAAAINVLKSYTIHGRIGDPTQIELDPSEGPVWESKSGNWKVVIERGRWLPGGSFASFELTPEQVGHGLIPLRLAANAVRVKVERPIMSFIAAPAWIGGSKSETGVKARTTAVKGSPEVGCVAPFALPACALVHNGEFQTDSMTSADRVFMRTNRFCDTAVPGDPACKQIVPEFFYSPTSDVDDPAVVVKEPKCNWDNPRFADASDHFGVVGLPESAGSLSEQKVREVLENTTRPCVPARLGDRFQVLAGGLSEQESEIALWRQISVGYGDRSHPPYSTVFKNTTVSTKAHNDQVCAQAPDLGWGACNSRRYAYNGVRGRTYFPTERFGHGFLPQTSEDNITWPAVTGNTPLWKVQVPVIAPAGSVALDCPGGTGHGEQDPWVVAERQYEIVGFLSVNLFDTDVGRPPPINPSVLPGTNQWPANGSDLIWGFDRRHGTVASGPICYPDATGTGSAACAPCNIVRGRASEETDYLATDQTGEPDVNLVFNSGGTLRCACTDPPSCSTYTNGCVVYGGGWNPLLALEMCEGNIDLYQRLYNANELRTICPSIYRNE